MEVSIFLRKDRKSKIYSLDQSSTNNSDITNRIAIKYYLNRNIIVSMIRIANTNELMVSMILSALSLFLSFSLRQDILLLILVFLYDTRVRRIFGPLLTLSGDFPFSQEKIYSSSEFSESRIVRKINKEFFIFYSNFGVISSVGVWPLNSLNIT